MILKEEREGILLLRINTKEKILPMETEKLFESYYANTVLITVYSSIKINKAIPGMVIKDLMQFVI